jgi:phage terminase large subunit-like protein
LDDLKRHELETLIRTLETRKKQRKFFQMFPDEGPHRRELYPKHEAFMNATTNYRELAFVAANRCISPWTWVETTDHTKVRAPEAFSGSYGGVLGWDGEREGSGSPSGIFLRSVSPAFRVVLDNGEFFDCTDKHQVLTTEGWLSLDQLMSISDVLRLTHKASDFEAYCRKARYLCDQPPRWDLNTDPEAPPSRYDALGKGLVWSRKDALERIEVYMRACQDDDLLPSTGDLSQLSALFELFSAPKTPHHVLPLTCEPQKSLQYALESSLEREVILAESGQFSVLSLIGGGDLNHYLKDIEICSILGNPDELQYALKQPQCSKEKQVLRGDLTISVVYPLSSPKLVGGRSVACVLPIGWQPIVDSTIHPINSYKAGGVYHHNCGKTVTGTYMDTAFATGMYPDWWKGRRFNSPITVWVAGDNAKTVRDILQVELIGPHDSRGTGMIPGELITRTTPKAGVPDALDTVYVKHHDENGDFDGHSMIQFKSYDQGRIAYQGTAIEVVHLDEECPIEIYTECLIRTMTTKGIVFLTFTPLTGLTPLVLSFMPGGSPPKS